MTDGRSAERWRLPGWASTLLGFIGGVAGTLLTIFLTNWLSLGEADIVYVGGSAPVRPVVDVRQKGDRIVVHVKIEPLFKNKGFKKGHVDRVEINPIGLTPNPEKVDVIFLDRTPLRWQEARKIRCEFLAVIRPQDIAMSVSADKPSIAFGAAFRSPDGKEIYWQGIEGFFYQKPNQPSVPQEPKEK